MLSTQIKHTKGEGGSSKYLRKKREKANIMSLIKATTLAWRQGISLTPLRAKNILPVAPLFVFVFRQVPFVWNKQKIIHQRKKKFK
jgi:hypothetical protein